MGIREPSFKIDEKLKDAQIGDYNNWLKMEWFAENENCTKFMNELMNTLELECKSVSDLKQMFEVMNMLAFHTRFGRIVDKMEDVREALGKALRNAQCDFEYSELVGFFKQYQYKIESEKRKQVQEKTGDYDKEIEQM